MSPGSRPQSGSAVDIDRVPDTDAAVWRRLRDDAERSSSGRRISPSSRIARTTRRSRPVLNPRDCPGRPADRAPGSAALVAARIARQPSGRTPASDADSRGVCGTVGYKGTRGLVDTEGVVPLSRTMDHVGVLAASVRDAAIVFQAMAGSSVDVVDPDSLEVRGRRASDGCGSACRPGTSAAAHRPVCSKHEIAPPRRSARRAGTSSGRRPGGAALEVGAPDDPARRGLGVPLASSA